AGSNHRQSHRRLVWRCAAGPGFRLVARAVALTRPAHTTAGGLHGLAAAALYSVAAGRPQPLGSAADRLRLRAPALRKTRRGVLSGAHFLRAAADRSGLGLLGNEPLTQPHFPLFPAGHHGPTAHAGLQYIRSSPAIAGFSYGYRNRALV